MFGWDEFFGEKGGFFLFVGGTTHGHVRRDWKEHFTEGDRWGEGKNVHIKKEGKTPPLRT